MKNLFVLVATATSLTFAQNATQKIELFTRPTYEDKDFTGTQIHQITEAKLEKVNTTPTTSEAIVLIKGVMEGNLCSAQEFVLEQKSLGSDFKRPTMIYRSRLNIIYLERAKLLTLSPLPCLSFSRPTPFEVRARYMVPTNGIPPIGNRYEQSILTRDSFKDLNVDYLLTVEWAPNSGWNVELSTR